MVCDCLDLSVWHRSTYDRDTLRPVPDVPVHANRDNGVQHQVAGLVAPVETRPWEVACQETPEVSVPGACEIGRLTLNQRRRQECGWRGSGFADESVEESHSLIVSLS